MGSPWTAIAWTLTAAGVAMFMYAAFWDRPGRRGRPAYRCRRCWYDLTGTADRLGSLQGVVCPECGRAHHSRRALRRTRRKRWAVLVSLGVLAGAYASSVWPRVSAYGFVNGWVGAVPTPALILMVPLLDDTPGSYARPQGLPVARWPLMEQVSAQVVGRLSTEDETGWFEHWLFHRVARVTPPSVLTDGTSKRGHVFTSVYGNWARQRRLWSDEEDWARSVYFMQLELPESLPQMSPVHARVTSFRRLVEDRACRVRLHERVYEVRRGTLLPADLEYRERWDGTVRLSDYLRWVNSMQASPREMLPIAGIIFEGDRTADIWWPVGEIREVHGVNIVHETPGTRTDVIGAIEGYRLVEDVDAIRAWVQSRIRVEFEWEQDRIGNRIGWPKGVVFRMQDLPDGPGLDAGFTFGGSIVLMARLEGQEDGVVIASLDPTWWGVRVRDGFVEFVGHAQWVGFEEADGMGFEYLTGLHEVRVESMWIEIHPKGGVVGGGEYAPLWDPEVERVFPEPLRIEFSESEMGGLREKLDAYPAW
ncbi:MAG: hypothetical protein D6692_04515 [Planctomycetota bacterium]|nr:MAG: hypothetical protein D6692_04515 [Planctomycetota bacterium]